MRDISIDNLKGMLIFLVVFGHLLELFHRAYEGVYSNLYNFIYLFHMPLFVLLTGYFAKRVSTKKIINFLSLYVIFQFGYMCFSFIFLYRHLDFFVPYFHLWYLMSMIWWYLAAFIINKLNIRYKSVIVIVVSIIAAIGIRYISITNVGLVSSYTLSFFRTIVFAPFFFIGFFMTDRFIKKIRTTKFLSILLLITGISLSSYVIITTNNFALDYLLRGAFSLMTIEDSFGEKVSLVQIITIFLSSLMLCFFLLSLKIDSKNVITRFGQNSLSIFLFHVLFYSVLYHIYTLIPKNSILILIIIAIYSFITCLVLSNQKVMQLVNPIINPLDTITRFKTSKVIKSNN